MEFIDNINIDTFRLRINLKYAAGLIYKKDNKNGYESLLPTDNSVGGEGVLTYPLGWKIDPYFSSSFITQITESFVLTKYEKRATANFWDPVTSQQAWGFEYSYNDSGNIVLSRLGFSLKQVRAYHYTKLTDDRSTKEINERYKPESGIQWKTETKLKLTEALDYRGIFDAFSTFDDMTKWTLLFQNEFKINVWKIIGILLKIDLIYNEQQALRVQYKQSLRFGIVMDIK
jgi:hypothetical protein